MLWEQFDSEYNKVKKKNRVREEILVDRILPLLRHCRTTKWKKKKKKQTKAKEKEERRYVDGLRAPGNMRRMRDPVYELFKTWLTAFNSIHIYIFMYVCMDVYKYVLDAMVYCTSTWRSGHEFQNFSQIDLNYIKNNITKINYFDKFLIFYVV